MTKNDEFDDWLATLNPETAKGFRKASEVKLEFLETPSLGINMAIEGLRYGGFTTLYGNKGSGKTTLALEMLALAQKAGKRCAWMDVEKNFNPEYAKKLGVDPTKVALNNRIMSVAALGNQGQDLMEKGAEFLVVDSISQLLPSSYFEDAKEGSTEFKDFGQTGQIGTYSKDIGKAINMINAVNEKAVVIFISQVRNKIGSYGAALSFMGGNALEHANSTVIKLWRTPSDIIHADVDLGDLTLKKPVGAPITWTIDKNRGPGMNWSNTYDIYFGGKTRGIDLTGEIVTYGVEYGVIKKGGAWFTIPKELIGTSEDERFQGRDKTVAFVRDNPGVQEIIYKEILAKSI